MKKKIFIGSDFPHYQYIYVIPILDGFLQKEKIKNIIFEDRLPITITKNQFLKKILDKYEISYAEDYASSFYLKSNLINLLLVLLNNPFKFLKYLFGIFFKNKEKKNIYNEIYHAVIDYSNYLSSPNKGKRDFISLIKSLLINFRKFCLIKKIIYSKKNSIKYAVLGHSVYHSRVAIALFRKKRIKTIIQANSILFFIPRHKDIHFSFLNLNRYSKTKIKIKKKIIDAYWSKRIKGKGNYQDANFAAKKNYIYKKKKYYNFIFLHVFKDSPFHYIDNNRIFLDYYEWVSKTLNILSNTDEKWVLKLHPSFSRWGENQKEIVNDLIIKHYRGNMKNLIIDDKMSNIEIFRFAKKIVTFNGTMHLEVASFGKKPIVITDVTLSEHDKSLVRKPRNINEYKNFLLNDKFGNFKIKNKNKIDLAKKLIFIRENVFPIKQDIGEITVYKNDSQKRLNENINSIKNKTLKNLKFLRENGIFLSKYKISTFSKIYLNKLK